MFMRAADISKRLLISLCISSQPNVIFIVLSCDIISIVWYGCTKRRHTWCLSACSTKLSSATGRWRAIDVAGIKVTPQMSKSIHSVTTDTMLSIVSRQNLLTLRQKTLFAEDSSVSPEKTGIPKVYCKYTSVNLLLLSFSRKRSFII